MVEVSMVPFYRLARVRKAIKMPGVGNGKTTIHGIEVPLPSMNDGRVSRRSVHRVLSHGVAAEM
jgi:hypothetical protein